jgi:hypothetical protein
MDAEQKKKLTFIVTTFAIIIIFVFLVKYGMALFLDDFDYFKAF